MSSRIAPTPAVVAGPKDDDLDSAPLKDEAEINWSAVGVTAVSAVISIVAANFLFNSGLAHTDVMWQQAVYGYAGACYSVIAVALMLRIKRFLSDPNERDKAKVGTQIAVLALAPLVVPFVCGQALVRRVCGLRK